MHHHTGSFVDDHHRVVFVNDIQCNVLGFKARVVFDGGLKRQHFMTMQLGFRLGLRAVHRQLTSVNPRF